MPLVGFKAIPFQAFTLAALEANRLSVEPGVRLVAPANLLPVSTERWDILSIQLAVLVQFKIRARYANEAAFSKLEEVRANLIKAQEFAELHGTEGEVDHFRAEVRNVERELNEFGVKQTEELMADANPFVLRAELQIAHEPVWQSSLQFEREPGPLSAPSINAARTQVEREVVMRHTSLLQFTTAPRVVERQPIELIFGFSMAANAPAGKTGLEVVEGMTFPSLEVSKTFLSYQIVGSR